MEPITSTDDPGRATGDAYLDTVALLQEEIGRLEAELRLRDEAPLDVGPSPADRRDAAEATRRIAELSELLNERDETIALLWEQLSGLEEAHAARAAEWDQLRHWVEELEHRIGETDTPPTDSDEGYREAGALRDQLEAQRGCWEQQRRRLEEEISVLRARLDNAKDGLGSPDLDALEGENRRLREECLRLAMLDVGATEQADRDDQVRALRGQLDNTRQKLQAAQDDLRSERLRHQAELAELRSQQAASRLSGGELPPHERIRAFREHLRELQIQEDQERQGRQLSNRIYRLWHRSGPRR